MHIEPVLMSLRAAISTQLAIGGADPSLEVAAEQLVEALGPAMRQAIVELAQQAAAEVGAQLPEQAIDIILTGDDLELRVVEAPSTEAAGDPEEFDARITLRLPPTLKSRIERVANVDGESVNSWVVDALSRTARRTGSSGRTVTEDFDL